MDPIFVLSVAVGLVALAVLVNSLVVLARPYLSNISLKVAQQPMAKASSVITSAESALASPLVQSIVVSVLTDLAAKLEASTTDPTVKSLEVLGFSLVLDRVNAIGAKPAPIPAPAPAAS